MTIVYKAEFQYFLFWALLEFSRTKNLITFYSGVGWNL